MKKIVLILTSLIMLASCDDGDIIVTSFDFEDASLQVCEGADSYVFFKINDASQESLSLRLVVIEDDFIDPEDQEFILNGTTNFANYRKYNGDITASYFCNSIPPSSPIVTIEYDGNSGVATLTKEIVRDDNDGVEEDVDDDLDTDGDGIPNYYDSDDDGDNVPTSAEIGTGDELMNSDSDEIPDYLDPDDDNDLVLTRYEANGGLDPRLIITNPDVGPDYLNIFEANSVPIDEYRLHTYQIMSSISLFISDLVLQSDSEVITQESLSVGEITNIINELISDIPDFN